MSVTEETHDLADQPLGGSTINKTAESLFDQIGEAIQESKLQKPLDLPIPGTNDLLWARYRAFPVAVTERKQEEFRKASERGRPILLAAACDTLVDACEQIMVLPKQFDGEPGKDGENLVPIDDTIPVRYEKRLVDLFLKAKMGEDYVNQVRSAREVVLAMFPTEQAVIAQNVEVSQWMMGVNRKAPEEALGNS
jgi:hypothetical protein